MTHPNSMEPIIQHIAVHANKKDRATGYPLYHNRYGESNWHEGRTFNQNRIRYCWKDLDRISNEIKGVCHVTI